MIQIGADLCTYVPCLQTQICAARKLKLAETRDDPYPFFLWLMVCISFLNTNVGRSPVPTNPLWIILHHPVKKTDPAAN